MSRHCVILIVMLGAQTHLLRAQVMVEHGAVSGAAAAAGAAAAGKSVTGVLGKLNQTLAGAAKPVEAAKPAPLPVTTAPLPATAAVKPPAATTEPAVPADFSALAIGMDRADML